MPLEFVQKHSKRGMYFGSKKRGCTIIMLRMYSIIISILLSIRAMSHYCPWDNFETAFRDGAWEGFVFV